MRLLSYELWVAQCNDANRRNHEVDSNGDYGRFKFKEKKKDYSEILTGRGIEVKHGEEYSFELKMILIDTLNNSCFHGFYALII